MDTPHHHPRFRREPRPHPRRTSKLHQHSASEEQVPLSQDRPLQPPETVPQDGDAEGGIHALLHQGMHLAEHDHVEEALEVLTRARSLAETYRLPGLEVQALYNQGLVRAQQGQPRAAQPLLKRALEGFAALDDPRMQASVSIALGQVLLETQQPEHAVLVLRRALKHLTNPGEAHRIDPAEWHSLRFALLRGLGVAYQSTGQLDRALRTYQQALESDVREIGALEYATLFVPLLQLYADLGQVEAALAAGQGWLETLDATDPEALHLFVELSFEFGLLCSEWERHPEAVRAYKATYAAWYRLHPPTADPGQREAAPAFIGKVLANIGTAYLHQQAFREAVAYLRRAQDILEPLADDEAPIPQQNLALLRQMFQEHGRFERLWRESQPLYEHLRSGPTTLPS